MSRPGTYYQDMTVSMETIYATDPFIMLSESIRRVLLELRDKLADDPVPVMPIFDTFKVGVSRNNTYNTYRIEVKVQARGISPRR